MMCPLMDPCDLRPLVAKNLKKKAVLQLKGDSLCCFFVFVTGSYVG